MSTAVTWSCRASSGSPSRTCRRSCRSWTRRRQVDGNGASHRLLALDGGTRPARTGDLRATSRGGGIRLRNDLRPFPSVDRRPRVEPVRVDGARRNRGRHRDPPGRHGRDLPDRPVPPRDRGAGGGDGGRDVRGPLLARRRYGREPQRARGRPPLARVGGARRDARGGGHHHPPALGRRLGVTSRPPLHLRERAPVHASRRASADRGRGRWPASCRAGRAHRRRTDQLQPRSRRGAPLRRGGRTREAALRAATRRTKPRPDAPPTRSARTSPSRASSATSCPIRSTTSRRSRW